MISCICSWDIKNTFDDTAATDICHLSWVDKYPYILKPKSSWIDCKHFINMKYRQIVLISRKSSRLSDRLKVFFAEYDNYLRYILIPVTFFTTGLTLILSFSTRKLYVKWEDAKAESPLGLATWFGHFTCFFLGKILLEAIIISNTRFKCRFWRPNSDNVTCLLVNTLGQARRKDIIFSAAPSPFHHLLKCQQMMSAFVNIWLKRFIWLATCQRQLQ